MKSSLDEIIKDILDVCAKHNISISHEDDQGGFKIEDHNQIDEEWFKEARDFRKQEK